MKMWRLKDGSVREEFDRKMNEEWADGECEDLWLKYKRCVDKVSKEVCEVSNLKQRHGETWWWRGDVQEAIKEKKKRYNQWRSDGSEESRLLYIRSKNCAKKMVARAMKEKVEEEVQRGDCFFKKLRQFQKDAKDVSECPCIRDKDGKIHHEEAERAKIWKMHMEKIMNEENEWHDLLESTETVGPVNQISMVEILSALNNMKDSKAGGPTGIMKEHLTASSHGAEVLKQIGNELLEGGEMPEDWKVSTLVPI